MHDGFSVLPRTSDVLSGSWAHSKAVWQGQGQDAVTYSLVSECFSLVLLLAGHDLQSDRIFMFVCEAALFIPVQAMIEDAATTQTTKLQVYKSDIQMLHYVLYLDVPNTK